MQQQQEPAASRPLPPASLLSAPLLADLCLPSRRRNGPDPSDRQKPPRLPRSRVRPCLALCEPCWPLAARGSAGSTGEAQGLEGARRRRRELAVHVTSAARDTTARRAANDALHERSSTLTTSTQHFDHRTPLTVTHKHETSTFNSLQPHATESCPRAEHSTLSNNFR